MPLFFFDIHDGEKLPDRQGLELESIGEAQAHAMQIVMSFLKQEPSEVWRNTSWTVAIRDESRETLFQLEVQVSQGSRLS